MKKGVTHAKKVMYIDFFIDLHHIFDVRRRFLSPCVSTLTHGKKAMYIDFFIDLHHKFDLHRSFLSPCVFTLTLQGSFWGSWAWADVSGGPMCATPKKSMCIEVFCNRVSPP